MDFLEVLSFILIYIVLPIAGIATLVYLIMLLNQLTQTVKRANKLMDEVDERIAMLDGPINMVVNLYETINSATATISGILASLSVFKKHKNKKEDTFDQ